MTRVAVAAPTGGGDADREPKLVVNEIFGPT